MMRSLFSGVSGLRVHQTRMDVIGNNLANVNTVGFKAARMTFSDAMSQRIRGASGDNPDVGRAGRNPTQIGLGVNIGGIDAMKQQGAAQRTDRALDVTVQGEGYFIVSDSQGTFFTRAGNIDWNGHRFSIGGRQLMGWNAIEDPRRPGTFVIEQGTVQPLVTPQELRFMDPNPTSLIEAMGNLNINDLIDGHIVRSVQFYDTLGTLYTADVRFTWHPPGAEGVTPPSTNAVSYWSFQFLPTGPLDVPSDQVMVFPGGNRDNGVLVNMTIGIPDDVLPGVTPGNRGIIGFSPINGQMISKRVGDMPMPGPVPVPRLEFMLNFTVPALPPPSIIGDEGVVDLPAGFNAGGIRFNVDNIRQQMGENTTLRMNFVDGNVPGTLTDISIGGDGIIMARFTNGEMRAIGQIPLAFFLNPEGLERVGDNLWIPSANSGAFDGIGGHGDLLAGTLEMSNVDMAGEFTEMITTQRGFQANSRVITTSDEMLQELVNLKR